MTTGLQPGQTAWAADHFPLGIPNPFLWAVNLGSFAVAGVALVMRWGWLVAGAAIIVALAPLVLLNARLFRTAAASKRERAAGYTTLNGVELDLEQRHPLTGAVIRTAGAPALDKMDFAGLR